MGDWVDAESLRQILIGAIAVLGLIAALVIKVVRRLLLRLALVAAIVALAASLWMQRADLGDCAQTCSCKLFGYDVDIPPDANPNCA